MAHPYHEHRQHKVEHARVHHITKHYAHGGAVHHDDETEDRALIRKELKKHDAEKKHHRASGGAVKARMDRAPRRAKGGSVKHKGKTTVNVVVGHPGGPPAPMPMAPPVAALPRPLVAPPMPPPGMPPGIGPGMAPAGAGPPGLPMGPRKAGGRTYKKGGRVKAEGGAVQPRHLPLDQNVPSSSRYDPDRPTPKQPDGKYRGGRAYAKGGAVKDGPAWREGLRAGTQVQHSDGKDDQTGLNRGRPITYRSGGRIEHVTGTGGMGPKLPGGGGGGEARLAKQSRARRSYAKPNGAHG